MCKNVKYGIKMVGDWQLRKNPLIPIVFVEIFLKTIVTMY